MKTDTEMIVENMRVACAAFMFLTHSARQYDSKGGSEWWEGFRMKQRERLDRYKMIVALRRGGMRFTEISKRVGLTAAYTRTLFYRATARERWHASKSAEN